MKGPAQEVISIPKKPIKADDREGTSPEMTAEGAAAYAPVVPSKKKTPEKPEPKIPKKKGNELDATQQAVHCMLQDISYICVGKGIRKCCSTESVNDEQCINTEQFYSKKTLLVENDSYADNSEKVGTVNETESMEEITFEQGQIVKQNGPLVHPNNVLCSDALRDKVSFYSQFELAPTFREVCGERLITGGLQE